MSLSHQDILQEIPDSSLGEVRDLFKDNWPQNINAYYYVNNYIEWKNKKVTDIKFYCPDGRFDDGTIITIVHGQQICEIFIFTLEKSCNRLREALQKTKLIPWGISDKILFFQTVHGDHYPTLKEEINLRGLQIQYLDEAKLWYITKEEALSFSIEIPSEYKIGPLKEEHVDIINPIWPHFSELSHEYLTQLVKYNGGFGLFTKETDELCAWIMKNNYGCLAILQTTESHKRKGLGSLMAKYMCRYFAEQNVTPFCFIIKHNESSISLFRKLGFQSAHDISWVRI